MQNKTDVKFRYDRWEKLILKYYAKEIQYLNDILYAQFNEFKIAYYAKNSKCKLKIQQKFNNCKKKKAMQKTIFSR